MSTLPVIICKVSRVKVSPLTTTLLNLMLPVDICASDVVQNEKKIKIHMNLILLIVKWD